MDNGIILIDKPAGMTSFGVVARLRRVLSESNKKRVKIGHTGTLDPFATGLMIIVVGKECKNAANYSKLDKEYEAVIHLGRISTTGDPEGEIKDLSSEIPSKGEVKDVLARFMGEIIQTPPSYSAIKVGGIRAYDLARQGKEVKIPPRQVTIYNIKLLDYSYPLMKIRTHVSSGTYIRSLAEDIGKSLGTGGYCVQLRRTKVGNWTLEQAKQLSDYGITD